MSPSTRAFAGQIRRLGLTESETKAYMALVRHGPCTALQIARHSTLQRTEIYALMPRLATLGLIDETLDRPRRYRAMDPRIGLANLSKRSISQVENVTKTARQLVSALTELEERNQRPSVPEIRIVTGTGNMRSQFFEAVKSAQKEVWMMSGMSLISATRKSEFADFLKVVSSRRLRARLISELDPTAAVQLGSHLPLVEIRHCQGLRTDLFGIDDIVASIGLSPTNKQRPERTSYIVMTRPETVGIIRSFYEAFWENTIPYEVWMSTREDVSDGTRENALI